jgi:hypothetical protein
MARGRSTQCTNNSDPITSTSESLLGQNSATAHAHQSWVRRLAPDHCATEIHRPKSAVWPIRTGILQRGRTFEIKLPTPVTVSSDNLPAGPRLYTKNNKLHGLSPRANYTDRATAASRRSGCQLLRIEGATWSAWRIPTAVFSVF